MNTLTHDSRCERLDRLARVRELLLDNDKTPARRLAYVVWAGVLAGIVALQIAFFALSPRRATAHTKTRPALSWPTAMPVNMASKPLAQRELRARAVQNIEHNLSLKSPTWPVPTIALIMDDIGPARQWSEQALALPAAVTLAILPYGGGAASWSMRARGLGHQVLLHMPMEPLGLENPGRGALLKRLTAAQNRARLVAALKRVPGISGVNNHMGSRFTSCSSCMAEIAPLLSQKGLLFLDSLTSPTSAAAHVVRKAGVRTIRRDVFLDDSASPVAIAAQMRRAEMLARQNGVAVVIAHPRPQTMAALGPWLAHLRAAGIPLVPLSQALATRHAQARKAMLASAGF